ncbi:MAG: UDP-N-acetylglucosamine 2-epimerase (non-hydrolyzing) [Oligoflexia bacterium]|nr:UDP-N-acetylglucosamine 2-epimerase (non-hydrolyzing) [Oligoflexia bacterium]
MKIVSIVGTRPNFVKIAPILHVLANKDNHRHFESVLVHTGQHYDYKMSKKFFEDLEIPRPNFNLNIHQASELKQLSMIIDRLDDLFKKINPDLVIVVGDVTSTLAGAIVAKKNKIKLAHVEAGLRSHDSGMPEEINRILTDRLSDYLFTTEVSAFNNLTKEGISERKIYFVGNVMIDTLLKNKFEILNRSLKHNGKNYLVLTLHRQSNVDDQEKFCRIISEINKLSLKFQIIFPVHPRTEKNIKKFKLKLNKNITLIAPQGYLDFLALCSQAKAVLTDSGGIQEEAVILKVPTITLRENTERPITIGCGNNKLFGRKICGLQKLVIEEIKSYTPPSPPKYWDGKAAERIVKIIAKISKKNNI